MVRAGTLAGYLFGAMGFYTNFFASILQATAVLVDTVTVFTAAALLLTGAARDVWLRAGPIRVTAGTTVVVLLVAGVNYLGFRPPGVVHPVQEETCTYNVKSTDGVPIPLGRGGGIVQHLRPLSDEINSISVIAGLDDETANVETKHPLRLDVRVKGGDGLNRSLRRPDIVNNAFSRFEFPKPAKVRPRDVLVVEVVNESDEPVSIYVKQIDPGDSAGGAVGSVFVRGHVGNERGYEKAGHVLSGCVTRPGG